MIVQIVFLLAADMLQFWEGLPSDKQDSFVRTLIASSQPDVNVSSSVISSRSNSTRR